MEDQTAAEESVVPQTTGVIETDPTEANAKPATNDNVDILTLESEENGKVDNENQIDEISDILTEVNSAPVYSSVNIAPSSMSFPKSGLDDIIEEEKDGEKVVSPNTRSESSKSKHTQSGQNSPDRVPSALPKSRTGNGQRSGRLHNDNDELPNTSSTIYSTIGPSRGVSEFDQPEQWSNSRGSHAFTSPLLSPSFSPSPGLASPDFPKSSRVQIKNHGPVAKWLAKRQKKKVEQTAKDQTKHKGNKRYASHIQPKVDTRNDEYSPRGGVVPPIKSEKLEWNAKPLVETHNEIYRNGNKDGQRKVFSVRNEKLNWDAKSKVEDWNNDYKPEPMKKFQVFSEKLQWYEQSKLDTRNSSYVPAEYNSKPLTIVDENLHWSSYPKVDTHNTNFQQQNKKESIPIFHDNTKWKAAPKVNSVRPHYKPTVSNNIKVKTDRLNWTKEAKVNTFNPSYTRPKANANTVDRKNPRENNSGWSSHSSDSETEWYNSLPGSGQGPSSKSPDADPFRQHRKILFHSRDLVSDVNDPQLTSRSYPSIKSKNKISQNSFTQQNTKAAKPFTTHVSNDFKKEKRQETLKKIFKERVEPLPPIGTFRHREHEAVVYPESRTYPGYRSQRSQKIEVIDMQDLSLLTKRDRYSVFIN